MPLTERLRLFLDRQREGGALFLRLAVGARLVWGTQDNVFHWGRMLEFAAFLEGSGFPIPLVSAVVSAYAQFVCGLLFVAGAFTRTAAAVMVVNFLVAIGMVHLGADPFEETFPALAILATALFLLVHGPGVPSVDAWQARRRARVAAA